MFPKFLSTTAQNNFIKRKIKNTIDLHLQYVLALAVEPPHADPSPSPAPPEAAHVGAWPSRSDPRGSSARPAPPAPTGGGAARHVRSPGLSHRLAN